ncbi:MAG: hypothetical protein U0326_17100 [Polyangiales bacterium]
MTESRAVSPTGRWGGKITRRPLPDASTSLRGLSREQRVTLANLWLSQSATERRVASSFEVVHRALVELDADAGIVAVAARAVDDELRHAALCTEMASKYLGRAVRPPADLPFAHPSHPDASSEALRRALYVIGQCALNETFASAYLELCLTDATAPIARAALRELLSDEVDHARVGWAFLSTVSPSTRAELDGWLLPLAVCNLREWRALQLPDGHREVLRAHGVPARDAVERCLRDALEAMVIPGFERFGFAVDPLRRWASRGAPTA